MMPHLFLRAVTSEDVFGQVQPSGADPGPISRDFGLVRRADGLRPGATTKALVTEGVKQATAKKVEPVQSEL